MIYIMLLMSVERAKSVWFDMIAVEGNAKLSTND